MLCRQLNSLCVTLTILSALGATAFAQDSLPRYGQGVPSAVRLINKRGLTYLKATQNPDGSWTAGQGGPGVTDSPSHADEHDTQLRWLNGDSLPGKLLESQGDQIRWKAPAFMDEVLVHASALESVEFPAAQDNHSLKTDGAFRVATTFGDVFTADLVGADNETLKFANSRFGKFTVRRSAVYSLDRRINPNLVFDGSKFKDWGLDFEGPIEDLTFSVYKGSWQPGDALDLSEIKPHRTGRLASGVLDLGPSGQRERFGMAFDGRLEVKQAGQYQFDLRADDRAIVYIDGKYLLDSLHVEQRFSLEAKLSAGSHAIRVEYVDYGGDASLDLVWSGPGFQDKRLSADRTASLWQRGPGGHALTERNGRVEETNSNHVTLGTAFSDVPVPCAIAGASSLRFNAAGNPMRERGNSGDTSVTHPVTKALDELRFETESLHGLLLFDSANSPLSWKPQGADQPLRLSLDGDAHIERSAPNVNNGLSFDAETFPHLIHLHSGEVMPCRVLSYDEESLEFRSPFLQTRKLKSSHVKAIEFNVESLNMRSMNNPHSGLAFTSDDLRGADIPFINLVELQLGAFKHERFASPFSDWIVRPSKEPQFGKTP